MSKTNGSKFKIEKGVPLPVPNGGIGKPAKYPWADMEVGDSFSISNMSLQTISGTAFAYGKRHGMKFSTRKQNDGSVRVWRVA